MVSCVGMRSSHEQSGVLKYLFGNSIQDILLNFVQLTHGYPRVVYDESLRGIDDVLMKSAFVIKNV